MGDRTDVSKKLGYANRRFSDEDLEALPLKENTYPYEEVDFSQNSLSADGLHKILSLCEKCDKLRILKLYKNDIDDAGATQLGGFLKNCSTLEEIHLSHNHFTVQGVEAIVKAAQEARSDKQSALWCRLEQNDVKDPEKVIRDLTKSHSCAMVVKRDRGVSGCKVHLPHFCFQRGHEPSKGRGKGKGGDRWEEDDWYAADRQDRRGGGGRDRHSDRDGYGDRHSDRESRRDDRREERSPRRRPMRVKTEEVDEPRPKTQLKMTNAIFLRAMGGALAGGGQAKEEPMDEKRTGGATLTAPAGKRKAGLVGALLSRAGVITKESKKKRVKLLAAKKEGGEADAEGSEEEEAEAASAAESSDAGSKAGSEAKAGSAAASEAEAASGSEAGKEDEASSAKGSADAAPAASEEIPARQRRAASPPAQQQQQRSRPRRAAASPPRRGAASPPPRRRTPPRYEARRSDRRGGGVDRRPRSLPRRGERPRHGGSDRPRGVERRRVMEDRPRRRGDSRRREAPRRRGDEVRRGGRMDDRSRSPRRTRAVGGREAPRDDGRGAGRERRREAVGSRGERDDDRGDRQKARPVSTRGTNVRSLSPSEPPARRAEPARDDARARASARAEKLVEDLKVRDQSPVPAKKEPEHPRHVVAARPKGGPKKPAPASTTQAAPREAPSRTTTASKAVASKPAAAAGAGPDSEYSYTEETEYTEETASEEEAGTKAKPARAA